MASHSFRTSLESATNAASYTFSSVDIGTAAHDRLSVVGITAVAPSGASIVDSITIGGSAATFDAGASSGHTSEIWQLPVSTGATASIVINHSSSMISCSIGVWAVYGVQAVPFDTASTFSGNASIDIPAGGIVIANARTDTGAVTWTGAIENFDNVALGDSGVAGHSGGSRQATSTEIGTTIDTSSSTDFLAVVSWAPGSAMFPFPGNPMLPLLVR